MTIQELDKYCKDNNKVIVVHSGTFGGILPATLRTENKRL